MPDPDSIEALIVDVVFYDGRSWAVTVENPDMIRYEDDAARLKLGTAQAQPIKWQSYVAWAALTRGREIDGMPFEAFKREARHVRARQPQTVDPTQTASEDD